MKNTYTTSLNLPKLDFILLIFRIGISILMLFHGVPKLITFFTEDEINFADPLGAGQTLTFTIAVLAEFVCSVMIILGLATRIATIPLILTIGIAAIIVHMPDGMAKQELPFLYLLSYILLFYTGAGKFSLDHYFMYRAEKKG
ncbi:DoxX family protein [Zunongwangia endophytica]|uniref:DoxX family protein n=1 Tax=Zunongwangia endophytica TaxID=1808945 RepID=A0ABV8HFI9_9FLAO|nr:DoxX family protein [Zunongwangia endophytica]MDN3594112.1 DoxX family protein [Zunongwangia endophytica]